MLALALLCFPLLYLPGLLLSWAFAGAALPADALERHFERVAVGALLHGWLALTLAELGVFSLPLHAALILLLCIGLLLIARRKGHLPFTRRASLTTRQSPVDMAVCAAILVVAFALSARPFEMVRGVMDAGTYANSGLAIAQTGAIVQHDALMAQIAGDTASPDPAVAEPAAQALTNFFASQPRERFIATRLRASGFLVLEGEAQLGRVVPQGLHLLPAWIALLASFGGPLLGLWAPGLLGLLGCWSVGMLGRRLAGRWVGALAALLLALNGVQVWFSRYSTAETSMQFLLFAGLYFFAKMAAPGASPATDDRRQTVDSTAPSGSTDEHNRVSPQHSVLSTQHSVLSTQSSALSTQHSALSTQHSALSTQHSVLSTQSSVLYALLAGLAIGQIALTRLDFFLVGGPLIPVAAYLLYSALSRRWGRAHTAFALGLTLMLAQAALHISFISRAYFFDTTAARLRDSAVVATLALPFLTETMREVMYTTTSSPLKNPWRPWGELTGLAVAITGFVLLARQRRIVAAAEALVLRWRRAAVAVAVAGLVMLAAWAYLVRPGILDDDILFNTRGGWSDPLALSPQFVQQQWVDTERVSPDTARRIFGVVLDVDRENCRTTLDAAATDAARAQLLAQRGPWAGPLSNSSVNWLRLQGYVGAPVEAPWCGDPRYTIARAGLVRVGWYLSPLGVLLAIAGAALWLRRISAASWLFLVVAVLGSFFYIRQTYGTGDQTYIYILRRFVPILYPSFTLCIAYAVVAIGRGLPQPKQKNVLVPSQLSPRQGLGVTAFSRTTPIHNLQSLFSNLQRAIAVGLSLALILFFLVTNRTLYAHTEYAGALQQFGAIAALFKPSTPASPGDIVLVRAGSRDLPDVVVTPLRFIFGIDALAVKSTSPASYASALAQQVRRWQSQGRAVYVAYGASGGDFTLPGFRLAPVQQIGLNLAEFQQLADQKPSLAQPWTLPLAVYRLDAAPAAALTTAPLRAGQLGTEDFAAQVRGFYPPDPAPAADGTRFAWTNGDALLRLPFSTTATTLSLRLAPGQRPATLPPAEVCLSLLVEQSAEQTAALPADAPFTPLGCRRLDPGFATVSFSLPSNLAPSPSGTLLIRLQSDQWVPAASDPRLSDRRPVGIQFASLTLR
jgi:hypothetical protein